MAGQFVQEGAAIDYTPDEDTPANTVVVIGGLVGVTKLPIPAGKLGAVHLEGVFTLPMVQQASSFDDVAIGVGEAVYWDSEVVTTEAEGNTPLGHCFADAASGDELIAVRLSN